MERLHAPRRSLLAASANVNLTVVFSTVRFPDPRRSTPAGIVLIGGDLRPQTLLAAYRRGIFPWPIEGYPLTWFCPPQRAILEFNRLHIPRSLAKFRRNCPWHFSIDERFDAVIERCAKVKRRGEAGTWITPQMIRAYIRLHKLGFAHSVEVWDGAQLVGGLYGVETDGAFGGESMFHLEPNASKLALLHLVEYLQARGAAWIDIQTLTPHLQALGAREITRDDFLTLLSTTRRRRLHLFERTMKTDSYDE